MTLDGTYELGNSLSSERQRMKALGVGPWAVRETLLCLEPARILRLRSVFPAVVPRVSTQETLCGLALSLRSLVSDEAGIWELQAARQIIEYVIGRHATLHRTEEDLAQRRQAFDANAAALGNMPPSERSDANFHAESVRTVSNCISGATLLALRTWLLKQRQTTHTTPVQCERELASHVDIFKAIEQGDRDAAEQAMATHMAQTVGVHWKVTAR